jgi:outer membrane immunogenic protein
MKNLLSALLLSSALGALPLGQALAADLPQKTVVKAPTAAPVPYTWTGFYVGAQIGYANQSFANTAGASIGPNQSNVGGSLGASNSGFLGGGFAGAQYQWSSGFVLGTEVEINALTQSANVVAAIQSGYTASLTDSTNLVGAGKVRVGWAFGNWLFYGFGGPAWDTSNVQVNLTQPGQTVTQLNGSSSNVGWTAGAGIDYAIPLDLSLTSAFFLRVEYAHYDIPGIGATVVGNGGGGLSSSDTIDVAKLGGGFKF